jgi:transcriptional regulator with XRE-family HTH domain
MTSMFQFGSRQQVESEAAASSRYVAAPGRNSPTSAYTPRDLGALLHERREAMGISLAEAEAATRIRQKYLAALEADEWHLLPGEVVGRGFLRNYSTFLGLEPNEVIERRRTIADDRLAAVLAPTSAGSALPPMRNVDYRPREVDLREEDQGMEVRELRLGPFFAVVAVALLAGLIWFAREPLTTLAVATADGVQSLFERPAAPVVTAAPTDIAIVNPENVGDATPVAPAGDAVSTGAVPVATTATDGGTTGGNAAQPPAGGEQPAPGVDPNLAILIPTSTPTPTEAAAVSETAPEPTPTEDALIPLPTPTEIPLVLPTPTPIPVEPAPAEPPAQEAAPEEEAPPEPPPVVAAACPDPRSAITSPGVNQVLSGIVPVTGTADHEAFQYYKLEFAPGANAGGGFVYFDGGNAPIVGGVLGNLNTTALPNGTYTLSISVVDQTGNFPPPCYVTVEIAN